MAIPSARPSDPVHQTLCNPFTSPWVSPHACGQDLMICPRPNKALSCPTTGPLMSCPILLSSPITTSDIPSSTETGPSDPGPPAPTHTLGASNADWGSIPKSIILSNTCTWRRKGTSYHYRTNFNSLSTAVVLALIKGSLSCKCLW